LFDSGAETLQAEEMMTLIMIQRQIAVYHTFNPKDISQISPISRSLQVGKIYSAIHHLVWKNGEKISIQFFFLNIHF